MVDPAKMVTTKIRFEKVSRSLLNGKQRNALVKNQHLMEKLSSGVLIVFTDTIKRIIMNDLRNMPWSEGGGQGFQGFRIRRYLD